MTRVLVLNQLIHEDNINYLYSNRRHLAVERCILLKILQLPIQNNLFCQNSVILMIQTCLYYLNNQSLNQSAVI